MLRHWGQLIGYARVSSAGQNLDRQLEAIGPVDRLFEERQSGSSRVRPVLTELLRYSRTGDKIIVTSMDRLARSVVDLNTIVQELSEKGVAVEFIKERLSFTPGSRDAFAEFQLNMMASFAQLERAIIKERQAEGIAAAKKRGVYKGRKKALTAEQLAQARTDIDRGIPKTVVARRLGIHRTTLHRSLSDTRKSSP